MKLISIVVPIYNSEKTLNRCIESVIAQDYSNLEIILINDGSNDKSDDICRIYLKKDIRIKYYYQENQGVSSARNRGIDIAKGEYIIFIDSDDYIEKNMISSMLCNCETDSDIVICGYDTYNLKEKNIIPYIFNYQELERKNFTQINFLKHLGCWILNFNNICMPWNKMFKLEKIKENNLYFPINISYGEDLMFNLLFFELANKVCWVPQILYHYEVGSTNSLEGKFKKDIFEQQHEQFEMLINLIKRKNLLNYYNKRNLASYFLGRIEYCIKMLFHEHSLLNIEEQYQEINNIISDRLVQASLSLIWPTLPNNMTELAALIKKRDSDSIFFKYSKLLEEDKIQERKITLILNRLVQYYELIDILGIRIFLKKLKRKLGRDNDV